MATAVLRSHDCLRDQFSRHMANPSPRTNHRRRKRSPVDRRSSNLSTSPPPSTGLIMGQVKILKRGEELKPKMFNNNHVGKKAGLNPDLCSTGRLGPDPEIVTKQIRVPDLYAGPTSIVSAPPPSSLPFPTALVRRSAMESDLRKLLRI